MLVEWVCSKSDADGVEMFVEVNTWAKPFFEKMGFDEQVVAEMPGDLGNVEHMMVRQPGGRFTFKDEVDGHLREGVHAVAPDGKPALPRALSLGTTMAMTPQIF